MKTDVELIGLLSQMPGMMDFRCGVQIAAYVLQTENVRGDIVEFGCNLGHTAALISALTCRQLWLYDSFQGLPEKTGKDITREDFVRGYLAVSPDSVREYFSRNGLPTPRIVPKWFKDVTPAEMPEFISFAHLDGDLYTSIKESLALVYPRLSAGAVCLVHDYGAEILQGVKPAVDEYLAALPDGAKPRQSFVPTPTQFCIIR